MPSTIAKLQRLQIARFLQRTLVFGATLSILLTATASARATTIATWTFETSQPATAGPFLPEAGNGSASGSHAGAAVNSNPAGDGSSHSFSSNTWTVGDYYQFQVSTTGLSQIDLDWDQTSSNTGPRDFNLEYSTDGTNFTTVGSTYELVANVAPIAWNATTFSNAFEFNVDLSSVTAIDNAANVFFRLVDADTIDAQNGVGGSGTAQVATAGTDRVDNFTVSTVPVPEPGSCLLAGMAALGLGLLSIRRRSE